MFDGTGAWVILPIIGLAFMLLLMSQMFFSPRGGLGRRVGGGSDAVGSHGMMGDDRQQYCTRDEDALGVLRRRYAAGELTDQELDAKRRRLEGR